MELSDNENKDFLDSVDLKTSSDSDLKETIRCCEQLMREYIYLEKKQNEVSDIEREIKNSLQYTSNQYSTFHYFWPFLIAAFASYFVTLSVIGSILRVTLNFDNSVYRFFAALPYIVPIIVLVIGFIVASRKRDNANLKIAEENRVTGDKRKALNERKEALNSEIRKLSMKLDSECGQIPRQYRNGASLKKLVKILRTEKARDLESAIKLMQ